jgi:hypothetical protein
MYKKFAKIRKVFLLIRRRLLMRKSEKIDIRKCLEISKLDDRRLLLVNPYHKGFFSKVLKISSENEQIKDFIGAVEEVKDAKIAPFWKPVIDPAFDGEKIVFQGGHFPAVGYSVNWWKEKAKQMPEVEGKHWTMGTAQHYNAFLVWLINRMIRAGWEAKEALEAVAIDSKELGHCSNTVRSYAPVNYSGHQEVCCYDEYYRQSSIIGSDEMMQVDKTGTWMVCGVCDLGNTSKLLKVTTNKHGDFRSSYLHAGCNYGFDSYKRPLAKITPGLVGTEDSPQKFDVGWLVLF